LRPAASGWLQTRADGIQINAGKTIKAAQARESRIRLELNDGSAEFDHVVLATGYRVDIARLGVLAGGLLRKIALQDGYPVLSRGFESSVSGLHFVGCSALGSFGPLPRFVAGCGFAAQRIAKACRAPSVRNARQALSRTVIEMPS
jgi:hypothetical protein